MRAAQLFVGVEGMPRALQQTLGLAINIEYDFINEREEAQGKCTAPQCEPNSVWGHPRILAVYPRNSLKIFAVVCRKVGDQYNIEDSLVYSIQQKTRQRRTAKYGHLTPRRLFLL